MRMQVALQKAQVFGHEGDVIGDVHPLRRHVVGSDDDLPLAGSERPGVVAGGGASFTDGDLVLIRARSADLFTGGVDQPQVDDVDLRRGSELAIFHSYRNLGAAFVFIRKRKRFNIHRHGEGNG